MGHLARMQTLPFFTCLPPAAIFKSTMFSWRFCFFQFGMSVNSLLLAKHIDHYKQQHESLFWGRMPFGDAKDL